MKRTFRFEVQDNRKHYPLEVVTVTSSSVPDLRHRRLEAKYQVKCDYARKYGIGYIIDGKFYIATGLVKAVEI